MHSVAEGWAMQTIDQYEIGDWPEWSGVMIKANEEAVTMPGLQTLIE